MSIKLTFHNYTSSDWAGGWSMNAEEGLKTVKQAPSHTLKKVGGTEVLHVDQEFLSWYVDGHFNCEVHWTPPDGVNNGFTIYATAPLQFLSMGAAPYWGYRAVTDGKLFAIKETTDQASVLTLTTEAGYEIRITPTCAHTSLEVEVSISKPAKKN